MTPILGRAIPESVDDQHLIGAAIDALTWKPAVVPLWARGLMLDIGGMDRLDGLGITPMFYATTHGMELMYVLAGAWDARIDLFAETLRDLAPEAIVRLNQEPNGGFGAPWTKWSPETYIAVFRYISKRIRRVAPGVKMAYCPIWRGRRHASDFRRWYPGRDVVQVFGFDAYFRTSRWPIWLVWRQARRTIRRISKAPIWVMEFGISAGVTDRARFLRGVRRVRGITGVVYFDIDLEFRGRWHRWALDADMERELERMSR